MKLEDFYLNELEELTTEFINLKQPKAFEMEKKIETMIKIFNYKTLNNRVKKRLNKLKNNQKILSKLFKEQLEIMKTDERNVLFKIYISTVFNFKLNDWQEIIFSFPNFKQKIIEKINLKNFCVVIEKEEIDLNNYININTTSINTLEEEENIIMIDNSSTKPYKKYYFPSCTKTKNETNSNNNFIFDSHIEKEYIFEIKTVIQLKDLEIYAEILEKFDIFLDSHFLRFFTLKVPLCSNFIKFTQNEFVNCCLFYHYNKKLADFYSLKSIKSKKNRKILKKAFFNFLKAEKVEIKNLRSLLEFLFNSNLLEDKNLSLNYLEVCIGLGYEKKLFETLLEEMKKDLNVEVRRKANEISKAKNFNLKKTEFKKTENLNFKLLNSLKVLLKKTTQQEIISYINEIHLSLLNSQFEDRRRFYKKLFKKLSYSKSKKYSKNINFTRRKILVELLKKIIKISPDCLIKNFNKHKKKLDETIKYEIYNIIVINTPFLEHNELNSTVSKTNSCNYKINTNLILKALKILCKTKDFYLKSKIFFFFKLFIEKRKFKVSSAVLAKFYLKNSRKIDEEVLFYIIYLISTCGTNLNINTESFLLNNLEENTFKLNNLEEKTFLGKLKEKIEKSNFLKFQYSQILKLRNGKEFVNIKNI